MYTRISGLSEKAIKTLTTNKELPFETIVQQISKDSVAFGFPKTDSFEAITFCWEKASELNADKVETFSELTTITLVGSGLLYDQKLLEKIYEVSSNCGCLIYYHDGLRVSLAVAKEQLSTALNILHGTFL